MDASVQQKICVSLSGLSSVVSTVLTLSFLHHRQATPDTTMPSKAEVQARGLLIDLFRAKPCMPIMVRLAWHDAGTFSAKDNTGGANASIRFQPEISHGANAGLTWATQQLQVRKKEAADGGKEEKWQVCSAIGVNSSLPPSLPLSPGDQGRRARDRLR